MKIALYLYLFGVFLTPFYFFNSGGIQLSDFFFITSLLSLLKNKNNFHFLKAVNMPGFYYLKVFVFWTLIVNLVYFVIWGDTFTLMSAFYYIYNFSLMVLSVTLCLYDRKTFLVRLYFITFLSITTIFVISYLNLDYLFSNKYFYRRSVTFNNPNQLGYWSLVVLSIITVIHKIIIKNGINIKYINIILFSSVLMSFYLSMISLSKAASISIVILIILFSFNKLKIILPMILLFFTVFYFVGMKEGNFIDKYFKRLDSIGESNDDGLEGRNYDRIWKYPDYLFFGAGEGAIEQRFEKDNEIHSTLGTILFSYGFFGITLFFLFLFSIYKKMKYEFIVIVLPIIAYGLTHMGIRFKLFWIVLALFSLYRDNHLRRSRDSKTSSNSV